MKIIQNLVDPSRYSIKCPYAMTPTRVVVHNTANDAPAANEIAYMIRNDNEVFFSLRCGRSGGSSGRT